MVGQPAWKHLPIPGCLCVLGNTCLHNFWCPLLFITWYQQEVPWLSPDWTLIQIKPLLSLFPLWDWNCSAMGTVAQSFLSEWGNRKYLLWSGCKGAGGVLMPFASTMALLVSFSDHRALHCTRICSFKNLWFLGVVCEVLGRAIVKSGVRWLGVLKLYFIFGISHHNHLDSGWSLQHKWEILKSGDKI